MHRHKKPHDWADLYYTVCMATPDAKMSMVSEIMLAFAERTGLFPEGSSPERYLWTDSFAVCNYLGLYRQTGDDQYRDLALRLVAQVHGVLGRHRRDDKRSGWISGMSEEEGRSHPTAGGLRIGKKMNERKQDEPFDDQLEWDRDGQYLHYLTQWMHALDAVSRATGEPVFNRWAVELAKTVHARFSYEPQKGSEKRLYWKMSIDLSYPLVPSMGHHDPLDGRITYEELERTDAQLSGNSSSQQLSGEISDMSCICAGKSWATDDALGIGSLLTAAYRIARLMHAGSDTGSLLETVLHDSLRSLKAFDSRSLRLPPDYRLAFRELGLSIGLQAIQKLKELVEQHTDVFQKSLGSVIVKGFEQFMALTDRINAFWMEKKSRESATWKEHQGINMVMLASSLAPDGYLC